jgi:putative chitinase
MAALFDREIFFNKVRATLFQGSMKQQQVDGMNFKLDVWEQHHADKDLRWLSYALATSKHETASAMWPVEEYGKGSGQPYGKKNAETGYAYYGRGDVQLTWDYNYKNASSRLGLTGGNDLYWHPDKALDPKISADVMFMGMEQGWFRAPHDFGDYFNDSKDDPYNARDIINGDKSRVPSWSNGVSIGKLIAGYYRNFYEALLAALIQTPQPEPEPTPEPEPVPPNLAPVVVAITAPDGVAVSVTINGRELVAA